MKNHGKDIKQLTPYVTRKNDFGLRNYINRCYLIKPLLKPGSYFYQCSSSGGDF
jgi:hypothetical protein